MTYFILIISNLFGAILVGLLGYCKSGTPWVWKKFAESFIAGVLAAIAWVIGYSLANGTLQGYDVLVAILTGAGMDNLINRISGVINKEK